MSFVRSIVVNSLQFFYKSIDLQLQLTIAMTELQKFAMLWRSRIVAAVNIETQEFHCGKNYSALITESHGS